MVTSLPSLFQSWPKAMIRDHDDTVCKGDANLSPQFISEPSAHMAVIEAIMVLYAKEVVTPDRVVAAIQRFSQAWSPPVEPLPSDHEDGLLLWVNKACCALRQKIEQELNHTATGADAENYEEITTLLNLHSSHNQLVSVQLCSKIKSGDKICDSCRKLLSNSVNKDQSTEPPSDDTDDDSPQEINISSPEKADALACLNRSLIAINESPIKKHRLLEKIYPAEKLKRVSEAFKFKVLETSDTSDSLETPSPGDEILLQMKEKFRTTTDKSVIMQILTTLPYSWTIQKIQDEFGVANYTARKAKILQKEKGIMSYPDSKPGKTLKREIAAKVQSFYESEEESRIMPGRKDFVSVKGDRLYTPDIRPLTELKDLCNGVCLAALISFYCPEELPWTDVIVNYFPTISDSVQNLSLVYNFCNRCLPSSVFHMMPEDVTYLRGSMKQNLLVFLADLFNVLEIHPVKCVRYPGTEKAAHFKEVYPRNSQGVAHKRSFPQSISAIPDLRSNLGAHSSGFTVSKSTPVLQTSLPIKKSQSLQQTDTHGKGMIDVADRDDRHNSSDEQFVVHRGRGVPTLSSVVNQSEEHLLPARLRPAKEKQNQDSKAEERGEPVAAGRPSNWEDTRRSSYAGRRSRRNSVTDDSQLTVENFGGSEENLQFLGRNPDKEVAVHVGRKTLPQEPTVPIRTNASEAARSSGLDLIFQDNNGYGPEKRDEEKVERVERYGPTVSLKEVLQPKLSDSVDGGEPVNMATSFAELSTKGKVGVDAVKAIHIVYMQQEKDEEEIPPPKPSILNKKPIVATNGGEKKTSFAALPNNTTTWQQQSSTSQLHQSETPPLDDPTNNNQGMATQLHNIRMKLEEKRRRIVSSSSSSLRLTTYDPTNNNQGMATQLHNIRMKLEEKRRRIESEKRRMEVVMSKQRQKVGKAAFLQAVTKGKGTFVKSPELDSGKDSNGDVVDNTIEKPQRPFSLQPQQAGIPSSLVPLGKLYHTEISEDVSSVEHKWLDGGAPFVEERKTPDIENMDLEQYQQSLAHYVAPPPAIDSQAQFYLHEQQGHRRTWAQSTPTPPPRDMFQPADTRLMWGDSPTNSVISRSVLKSQQYVLKVVFSRIIFHTPTLQLWLHSENSSPQHRGGPHKITHLMGDKQQHHVPPPSPPASEDKSRSPGIIHAPLPTPPVDDMEPQSISFIGMHKDNGHLLTQGIKGLHISSGSRTYRIPSPTRPAIARNSFQQQNLPEAPPLEADDETTEKGFYISFDDEKNQPKRPKPPLRTKRSSPKKERTVSQYEIPTNERDEFRVKPQLSRPDPPSLRAVEVKKQMEIEGASSGVGLVIGSELLNPDPNAQDEMERKKERIMLLSLQRRQQQEEQKQLKEQESHRRREIEKLKQEERERKKEEERLRRTAILEQYKLKKAIEEAEREGKLLPDKADHVGLKPVPKMRTKTSTTRPRPKTIHVDSGGVDITDDILSPSRSKKGSTSNLTEPVFSSPLRRDLYRGSQDSLADRLGDRRGVSSLFRGSSTDQDSMVYRYTDTDSGLGRATPPRRAPSPGMGSMRHLPSPSGVVREKNVCEKQKTSDKRAKQGPGSLPPGLMTKRRGFDDGSSDISSIPSSMLEYTGPRLYKQPATKSNRPIMLNAVEYCVFPGVVNREAKQRVREEISRSESKHFLILFRDTGCQFRALYSYCPDRDDEVLKLYGTGPKLVNDRMFDKFFKYNSGGKCFSQVHTKHLTVTIDAFTIHNSLWQGKKGSLPNKKDMALVI
uniref:(California timema) hypothetical protein n=1 Tax=Timema californicum TaxID=61474 RepID=A0A7R9P3F4_TIMCA|nr:unnamed protein product [Timema californicum]